MSVAIDAKFVDELVTQHGHGPEALIPVLQAIQDRYHYLPAEVLTHLSDVTAITPAAITGVSTFYQQFRHRPAGEHRIRVCHGTACHVKGSQQVEDAIRRHLNIADDEDTDPSMKFTVERVACVGCCSLAPVVQVDDATYGHLTYREAPAAVDDFVGGHHGEHGIHIDDAIHAEAELAANGKTPHVGEVHVSLDTCCLTSRADRVYRALRQSTKKLHLPVRVKRVGCMGLCQHGPTVAVTTGEGQRATYVGLGDESVDEVLWRHFQPRNLTQRVRRTAAHWLDRLLIGPVEDPLHAASAARRDPITVGIEPRQVRIASEHYGRLDPLDLDEYIASGGFEGLRKALESNDSEAVITTVEQSGLRGRGGGGFPSGIKWRRVHEASGDRKYVICNGDEGDPGAFMDRTLAESFPYRVLEGMMIAAYAVGADEGVFYVRHEYPLAVRRLRRAIETCENAGWLGDNIQGSGFSFKSRLVEGAGAFICGEETALIASIEGQRGVPRLRPPYPAQSGLWGQPTLVNNVETLANVPWIVRHGAEAYSAIGTETSKGTKVFALAGKVRRSGLIEIPLGMTLRQIVDELGGGVPGGKALKAVQIGGPSGGCIPATLADTPVDYEALKQIGAIMGSGGLIVLDEDDCMVDIARYFLQFTQTESCGKCTFCRIGTRRMLEILTRLCEGKASRRDLDELETLARQVAAASICGLGRTAPNPVLTTLKYFRHEYEAHLQGRCPSGKCQSLIKYEVNDRCIGCTLCAQHCPTDAIGMTPLFRHVIDDATCIRCDVCRQVCPAEAISVH
ncbi:4Fe-4S binding protein [Planctomycetales bacterium ZRK34]|nr:4Fe-4S binding protein [Planctomycetales bacterium ZRK34]